MTSGEEAKPNIEDVQTMNSGEDAKPNIEYVHQLVQEFGKKLALLEERAKSREKILSKNLEHKFSSLEKKCENVQTQVESVQEIAKKLTAMEERTKSRDELLAKNLEHKFSSLEKKCEHLQTQVLESAQASSDDMQQLEVKVGKAEKDLVEMRQFYQESLANYHRNARQVEKLDESVTNLRTCYLKGEKDNQRASSKMILNKGAIATIGGGVMVDQEQQYGIFQRMYKDAGTDKMDRTEFVAMMENLGLPKDACESLVEKCPLLNGSATIEEFAKWVFEEDSELQLAISAT
jgi:chromosome segregation ATPase